MFYVRLSGYMPGSTVHLPKDDRWTLSFLYLVNKLWDSYHVMTDNYYTYIEYQICVLICIIREIKKLLKN